MKDGTAYYVTGTVGEYTLVTLYVSEGRGVTRYRPRWMRDTLRESLHYVGLASDEEATQFMSIGLRF